jgi:hypothetical protein
MYTISTAAYHIFATKKPVCSFHSSNFSRPVPIASTHSCDLDMVNCSEVEILPYILDELTWRMAFSSRCEFCYAGVVLLGWKDDRQKTALDDRRAAEETVPNTSIP